MAHELGLERCEAVWILSIIGVGKIWEGLILVREDRKGLAYGLMVVMIMALPQSYAKNRELLKAYKASYWLQNKILISRLKIITFIGSMWMDAVNVFK